MSVDQLASLYHDLYTPLVFGSSITNLEKGYRKGRNAAAVEELFIMISPEIFQVYT
ncbi:MAG: hypothetical protein ACO2O0_06710 [Desulfurococcales archaeon]